MIVTPTHRVVAATCVMSLGEFQSRVLVSSTETSSAAAGLFGFDTGSIAAITTMPYGPHVLLSFVSLTNSFTTDTLNVNSVYSSPSLEALS